MRLDIRLELPLTLPPPPLQFSLLLHPLELIYSSVQENINLGEFLELPDFEHWLIERVTSDEIHQLIFPWVLKLHWFQPVSAVVSGLIILTVNRKIHQTLTAVSPPINNLGLEENGYSQWH